MEHLRKEELANIASLFEGWEDTMIYSCLQGHLGNAYVNDTKNPVSAKIIVGDFCFLAGVADMELVLYVPEDTISEDLLIIPQNEEWGKLIEKVFKEMAEKITRYSIKKEPDVFDEALLRSYTENLPQDYVLTMMDESLYLESKKQSWSLDFCSQFPAYEDYRKNGIGAAVLYHGNLVAGASSYTYYSGGIEIEIDTKREHRRKGLAKACASKLILECLEKGLYPSWDAHDLRSVKLAEKLGYHMEKPYDTYCVKVKGTNED